MKLQRTILAATAAAAITNVSNAATFIWYGSANDGNWTNTANWAGGAAPASLSSASNVAPDTINFNGTNMPTTNIVGFTSGTSNNGAIMNFNSGGSFNLSYSTSFQSGFVANTGGTYITVGDGIFGGTENVTLNISDAATLLRHASVAINYQVNADGVLNFSSGLNLYADGNKNVTLTLNGGALSATGSIGALFNTLAGSYFDFTEVGSSLTAAYGGAYADFAAVQADTNGNFVNNSGGILQFTDNGSSFTVTSAIPEPGSATLLLGGVAFLALGRRRVA